MPIPVSEKFHPLYTTDKPIILITGGRGSAKSFNTSLFAKRLTYEKNHTILYCRYTMTSAKKSIIPEFEEKISMEGDHKYFHVTDKEIVNNFSGSKILFDGIKTGSGNQTAKLKSIQGLSTFVVDEGEEWQNEEEFDVIKLSIRNTRAKNRTIIIMNPCADTHFIYRKYIKDHCRIEIIDGVPVQMSTHPDVCHIHTTYLDNLEHVSKEFLAEVAEIKRSDQNKYAHIVIGRWNDGSEDDSLFKIDKINDMFSNFITPTLQKYIVCDAAKYGRDFCVTMVFKGWEVLHISVLKKSDVHDILKDIELLRGKFGVQKSNCLVDGDGVGADTVSMGGYKSFHGGNKPKYVGGVLENYKNLKTQCAFYLAERIVNRGEILINANNQTITVDGACTSKIKVGNSVVDIRTLIIEDFRAIKYANVDGEGKKCINDKEDQKAKLGRSPDFFDVLNMRCYFDIMPKDVYL